MEEFDWINNIHTYFAILNEINVQFKILLKTTEYEVIEQKFYYLAVDLLRLVPICKDKEGNLILNKKDGICLLSPNIDFIFIDLEKIIEENSETFKKLKIIRNKYEHEPHNINGAFSTGHSSFSAMGFYYNTKLVSLNSIELTYIIYDLNKLMKKIEKFIIKIENENDKKINKFNRFYIKKIKDYKIEEYNKNYTRVPKNFSLSDNF